MYAFLNIITGDIFLQYNISPSDFLIFFTQKVREQTTINIPLNKKGLSTLTDCPP